MELAYTYSCSIQALKMLMTDQQMIPIGKKLQAINA